MRKVPEPTVKRLFHYYRCLQECEDNMSCEYICSDLLGEKTGIKSNLLRRDLSFFGHMGRKGKGYNISKLKNNLENIIGLNNEWNIALIGAGNLGTALIRYNKFRKMGLNIIEIFDNDLDKIGRKIAGYIVKNSKFIQKTINKREIKIVIIAINDNDIDNILHQIKDTDIKAVWNLTSSHINLGNEVVVVKGDLCCSLGSLIYNINN
ncbi:MAG: redox-sensing transcriptional repressor Rex [Bacillota bacterium]